jgi:hypothetical protein
MKDQAYYLAAPLELEPAADDKLPAKMSGIAYSGGVAEDYFGALVIDLSQTKVAAHLPLLYEHRRDQTVGVIHSMSNDGAKLGIDASLFVDDDPQAKSISTKAKAGLHWQLSIGLFGAKVDERQDVEINGQQFTGPVTVLHGGTVREVSVVALGADDNTNADFFSAGHSRHQPQEDNQMPDNDLQAKVDALEAKIADLAAERDNATERADKAEQAITDMKLSARTHAIKTLFAEIGREYSDESAKHYLALPDEVFEGIAADLRARKPQAPSHLFSEQATGSPGTGAAQIDTQSIYDSRRVA